MTSEDATIIAAITGAFITAVLPIVLARTGNAVKIREAEHLLKRAELIEKLLSLRTTHEERPEFPKEALMDELVDIAAAVEQSSVRRQIEEEIRFEKLPLWKRFYRVPRPRSIGGWFATVIFYLYGSAALLQIILGPVILYSNTGRPQTDTFLPYLAALVSLGIAWLGRLGAIRSARIHAKLARTRVAGATPPNSNNSVPVT